MNSFGFAGRIFSVTIVQLCCCILKAATDKMQMNGRGYVPITSFTESRGGPDLAHKL